MAELEELVERKLSTVPEIQWETTTIPQPFDLDSEPSENVVFSTDIQSLEAATTTEVNWDTTMDIMEEITSLPLFTSPERQPKKIKNVDEETKENTILSGKYHEVNPGQYHEVNPGQWKDETTGNPILSGHYHEVNPGQYHEVISAILLPSSFFSSF